ncbi:hypothetical protein C8A01DRAFT_51120 [Parachaetomium inaequale]|uniref:MYND-type zinc finger protein samB n=1 Tax=Parachaetomium inaequale TaxID=2588326 RepID=A0AAN6P575_9PEZI|nr:hypothetical protein C8A01DRAFT_51120 [Parachaetomium inaequale]
MSLTRASPITYIQDVPGKGVGLIATSKIPRGTRILAEEPVIVVSETVSTLEAIKSTVASQVDCLTKAQRQTFLSMPSIHPFRNSGEQYLGIVRTVGLPIDADGVSSGVFLEACRINHACDNNAQKSWNRKIKRHTVHALRDIDEGEEITIFYLGQLTKRSERQRSLQANFGFTCTCRLCSLPPKDSEESDKRLEEILRIERAINRGVMDFSHISAPLQMLRQHDIGLPRAHFDAAQILTANGDLARGSVFAKRALDGWIEKEGDDCDQVGEHGPALQDPSKFLVYGFSMKWKTAVDDVPRHLSPDDFEAWLWRRATAGCRKEFADLRDCATFPDFYNCLTRSGGRWQQQCHWCFMAEIVSVDTFLCLRFEVRDVSGKTAPMAFHTEGRGTEISPRDIRTGYTLGILYAERHAFAFGEPGIRQEDAATLKVFPLPMQKLLSLNDSIHQYATAADGARACHGCGRTGVALKQCAKCSMFWYCDKACQTGSWRNLQSSLCPFVFQPTDFDGRVCFPLPSEGVVPNR